MSPKSFSRTSVVALALAMPFFAAAQTPDLKTVVDNSMQAMGAANVKTIVISGQGWDGCVGQNYDPNADHWRRFSNRNYVRSIDFEARGWRLERIRGEGEVPGRGGCNAGPVPDQPQNQITMLNANSPFNTQMEFVMLPEGFLKTALEKNATVKTQRMNGKSYTVLSFMGELAPVNGYINDLGFVDRVETTINNDVMGDMTWTAEFSDWKDFSGLKFPTHIAQRQGGLGFFELNVAEVQVNAAVDLTPPPGRGRGGAGGGPGRGRGEAPRPVSEDLGGGFWLVTGGYGAIVADFKDDIVVVEGPQNDARALQIIAEAKRLVPNKPIRYVVNTHAHFDHSGGLRAFVAEGATIVTHKDNETFYQKVFKNPHTLVPDTLSKMNPQPPVKIEPVGDMKVLTDGEHTINLYHLENSTHAMGTLIVYLPKQKILVEADEFNVLSGAGGPANAPTPAVINPYHTNLLANVERLRLDVDRIIPIHLPNDGRKVSMAELYTAAGRAKP